MGVSMSTSSASQSIEISSGSTPSAIPLVEYLSESPTWRLKQEEDNETPTSSVNEYTSVSYPSYERSDSWVIKKTPVNREVRSMSNLDSFSIMPPEDNLEQIFKDFQKKDNVKKASEKLCNLIIKEKSDLELAAQSFCDIYQQLILDKYKEKYCNILMELSTFPHQNCKKFFLKVYTKNLGDKLLSQIICKKYEKDPDVLAGMISTLVQEDLQRMAKVEKIMFRDKECSAFLLGYYLRQHLTVPLKKIRADLESEIKDPSKYDLHSNENPNLEKNQDNFRSIVQKTFPFIERIQFNEHIRTLINKMVIYIQKNEKNTDHFSEDIIKNIIISNVLFFRCICQFFSDVQKHFIETERKKQMDVVLRNIFKVVQKCASNESFAEPNLCFMNPLIEGYHKLIEGFVLSILTTPQEKKKK